MNRLRIQIEGSLPWNPDLALKAICVIFPNGRFLSFEDAKEFVKTLNIKNYKLWRKYVESGSKSSNMPSNPQSNYKNEWQGWGDFLGTKSYGWKKNTSFVTFEESQRFIRKIGIKSFREWTSWCKKGLKPKNIPFSPYTVYKSEWRGWKDFLGTAK
jgi:hypothetical protein